MLNSPKARLGVVIGCTTILVLALCLVESMLFQTHSYSVVSSVGGWLNTASPALTALATALLTIVTYKLVQLGREQTETSRAQLRANVFVQGVRLVDFGVGKHPTAVITIKNFGHTPAYKMRQSAIMGYFPYPLRVDPPTLRDSTDPESVIAPGARFFMAPTLATEIMTQEKLDQIEAGTHALYVAGEINYEDCFKRPQTTRYLLFTGGGITKIGDFTAAGPGNDAT